MTRKLMPGDRVRHKATGREYTFHAHPSSQDFPGSRYVRDESGAIREFRADEIEAISTAPMKLTPTRLDEIVAIAKKATPGDFGIVVMNSAATLALVAEVRELRAKVELVRLLHRENAYPDRPVSRCRDCDDVWPCETARALGEEA